jgi:hypothetical protein
MWAVTAVVSSVFPAIPPAAGLVMFGGWQLAGSR